MSGDGATDLPVLIAGAGPTGLVLALWLTKLGVRVRIVDKAAEPGTTSRALAVQARTLELYRQAGIDEAVVSGGFKVEHLSFWVGGRRESRLPLGRIGEDVSPYAFALVFPQDAHERLLIERLEAAGVTVERPAELVGFEETGRGVRATLRRDGAEASVEARFLAGCDGAASAVRNQLGIGFPGGTYTGHFYVADVEASGPAIDGDIHVDLDAADFLLMFPFKAKGSARLVGVVHDDAGVAGRDLTFEDVGDKIIASLGIDISAVHWFSTYRVHHRV
ncbi:MAG TPA: FAD-dependent monooxygenase, partial [Thermoanaerobaculia bacterium]|nr:FAD-dependent monooxygenase [Thermoanaerobaculia bacterium]